MYVKEVEFLGKGTGQQQNNNNYDDPDMTPVDDDHKDESKKRKWYKSNQLNVNIMGKK